MKESVQNVKEKAQEAKSLKDKVRKEREVGNGDKSTRE